MNTITVVKQDTHLFFLPDANTQCDIMHGTELADVLPKRCSRKAVIAVAGSGYMGIGTYCHACWNQHCPKYNYPDLTEMLITLGGHHDPH